MKYILSILALTSISAIYGCLNITGTNLDGNIVGIDMIRFLKAPTDYPTQGTINDNLTRLRTELETAMEEDKDDIYSDIAGYMIYNGEYQEAIDYLQRNVTFKEFNYNYVSNIGVAYELIGNLDSALYYTSKGVELNPDSHSHSEWIHVRIIEVAMELENDPNWLENNNFFDFELSKTEVPTIFPEDINFLDFTWQLEYQLKERTFFVKPESENIIVAHLLLTLADLYAREYDTGEAQLTYAFAAEYDASIEEIVEDRLAYIHAFEEENGIENYEYSDKSGHNIAHDNEQHLHNEHEHVIYDEEDILDSHLALDDIRESEPKGLGLIVIPLITVILTALFLAVYLNRKK